MSEKISHKPSLSPVIFALFVLIIIAYILFKDLNPSRTEHTLNPPIEIIETPVDLPLTVIEEQTQVVASEVIIEQEAETFVDTLVKPSEDIIVVEEYQDKFVRHDSVILLPEQERRITTISALMSDNSLTSDTVVNVYYHKKEQQHTTLAELSRQINDHNTVITIITSDGHTLQQTLSELLSQNTVAPDDAIIYISKSKYKVTTTIAELSQLSIPPYQTVIAVISHQKQAIAIEAIIQSGEHKDSALFYVHRVTEQDTQGLWGIIQSGLISTFRQGLSLEGVSQNKDFLQAVIPANADEQLPSGLSSFLGKVLNEKVDSSYIYNYSNDSMGRDPNIIKPGQQVVLIHFTHDEIKQIYQFFSEQRNKDIKTFAIED